MQAALRALSLGIAGFLLAAGPVRAERADDKR